MYMYVPFKPLNLMEIKPALLVLKQPIFLFQVTRKYNVPALKYAMDLLGYYGGPCRLPLTDITPAEKEDVKNCFKDYLTS